MAVIQKYGQQQRLLTNQRYFITVHLPGQDYTFSFTSRYDPYFTQTRIVQGDIGKVLSDVPIEDVAQAIWQASLEIVDFMEAEGIAIPETPTRAMQQAARYRADYMLLLGVLSARHATAGQEQRRLRDLTVTLQVSRPDAESLLNRWKQLADEALSQLLDRSVIAASFVKAGQTAFPLGARLF